MKTEVISLHKHPTPFEVFWVKARDCENYDMSFEEDLYSAISQKLDNGEIVWVTMPLKNDYLQHMVGISAYAGRAIVVGGVRVSNNAALCEVGL